MKRVVLLIAVMTISADLGLAQPPPAPKPGPEHQKLAVFVGDWTFEGELKPGPMGPGGKMTGTDKIQWMPGGFFVERRFEGKGPMGEMKGLEILAYDPAKKAHTYTFFDSTGALGSGTMTVTGNTWNVAGMSSMGGKTMHDRCSLTVGAGSKSMMIKCEMSTDGKSWTPTFEGKATKAK